MSAVLTPLKRIEQKILLVRGHKVLLDADLAELYGVTTKRLNEQVKRNKERFPEHFMFQLNPQEVAALRSQFATANDAKRRTLPYVFTEHGTLQAANVLSSASAVQVSILVIEAFIKLRELTATQKAIVQKLNQHEERIGYLYELLEGLAASPTDANYQTRRIGFIREERENKTRSSRKSKLSS